MVDKQSSNSVTLMQTKFLPVTVRQPLTALYDDDLVSPLELDTEIQVIVSVHSSEALVSSA